MASLFVLHNRLVAAEDAVVDVTVVDRACCLNRKMRPDRARNPVFDLWAGIRTIDPASQTLLALQRHSAAPLGRKATDLAALSALAVILAGDLQPDRNPKKRWPFQLVPVIALAIADRLP